MAFSTGKFVRTEGNSEGMKADQYNNHFSNLKIRLNLTSSMYYFFPKKSNCNYQGLQHYSAFQKGLSTFSSFKCNFTFCMAVLSFRHGQKVHKVASKRLKTK
jgi:hypothetical protein